MTKKIIAVSAGLYRPKKDYNPFNLKNHYLNYGLLGLVSILDDNGHDAIMFQGDYKNPKDMLIEIVETGIDITESKNIILLSLPSYYALGWAKEFCTEIRAISDLKIVVGGRWVVGNNTDWLKARIPEVNLVLGGLVEGLIEIAVDPSRWGELNNIGTPPRNMKPFEKLNFSLLHNYVKYQPCIEVSRGCGKGCDFCMEKSTPLSKLKEPEKIINEIIEINHLYNNDVNYYFESSFFLPTDEWVDKFHSVYNSNFIKSKWRCETRVDNITPKAIEKLSKAGLKVLDLGLESASIKQLLKMNKTKNPKEYLSKASILLKACYSHNVYCKVNVLLYPGENKETIDETIKWLDINKKYIKGVSVNSLVVYGYDVDYSFVTENGGRVEKPSELWTYGYSNIVLSDDITREIADNEAIRISKRYMDFSSYYELKSYSYFPSDYSFNDFIKAFSNCDDKFLPFTIERDVKE